MSPSGFAPFATASVTDANPRSFVAGFSPPAPAIEDRLLCARAEAKWCSLEQASWSAVRALTITIEDNGVPAAGIGGELTAGGWRRGVQGFGFWGNDGGAGVRFGETTIDGGRVDLTEYLCQKVQVSGEWRGTRMQPCLTLVSGSATDRHDPVQRRPPHPRALRDGLRRERRLRRPEHRPDRQQPAGPPAVRRAGRRRRVAPRQRLRSLLGKSRPGPGEPDLGRLLADHRAGRVRHRGQAGARAERRLAHGPLGSGPRHLHAPPLAARRSRQRLRRERDRGTASARQRRPGRRLRADTRPRPRIGAPGLGRGDDHRRPLGTLGRRDRVPQPRRRELGRAADQTRPRRARRPGSPGRGAVPRDLGPGTYLFRADAVDGAGNTASTTRRADGTEMALRKVAVAGA